MKRLTCEMCGSQDLIKKDGVFECQSCGCKYTVEEAKKLMVEGVVEVKVTEPVKIDNSSKIDGFYEIARRAREDGNITQAAQYYNLILQEEPNSWEAQFYSVYYIAMDCKIAGIPNASYNIAGCLNSVISLMLANTKTETLQQLNLVKIGEDLVNISATFLKATRSFYVNTSDSIKNQYTLKFNDEAYAIESILTTFEKEVLKRFDNTVFGLTLANEALISAKLVCEAALKEVSRYILFPDAVKKRESELSRYSEKIKTNKERINELKEKEEINSDKEGNYTKYLKISNETDDIDELNKCLKVFEALGDFKDSKKQIEICKQKIDEIINSKNYDKAIELKNSGKYKEAIDVFDLILSYKDSSEQKEQCLKAAQEVVAANKQIKEKKKRKIKTIVISVTAIITSLAIAIPISISNSKYNDAIVLMAAGKYTEAINAFEELNGYSDSYVKIKECHYNIGTALLKKDKLQKAVGSFSKANDFKDSKNQMSQILKEIAIKDTITAGDDHTVGLKSDGTVVAVGSIYGECDVEEWTDIVAISAGDSHTIGLKSDGTVVAVGSSIYDACDVEEWTDIVAISAGYHHTVGLKSDGTVVAIGENTAHQCEVSGWTDIVAISAGYGHTVGLKSDGTVVATEFFPYRTGYDVPYYGQCDVEKWKDIVAISAGYDHTVGLKSDGTVVAVGSSIYGQCDVEKWKDIVAISAGDDYTVGLKSNGTVVAVGSNSFGQCDVLDWTDIVAISAGSSHTVGLKADGTVIATEYLGDNEYYDGQCNVSGWSDIKLPTKR